MSQQYQIFTDPVPPLSQRSGIGSGDTCLILDCDSGESSLVIQTGGDPSVYVDKYGNVGINTTWPTAQLEVASGNGSCIRLCYGLASTSPRADIFMNASGDMIFSPNATGAKSTFTSSLDLPNHDGVTRGLRLNGLLVEATAVHLGYTNVIPGTASEQKAVVLDNEKNISGIHSLSATTLIGTIATSEQPDITSVGPLSSLVVEGNVTIAGNIELTGSLSNMPDYIIAIMPGEATSSKALILDGNSSVMGINSLSASSVVISGSPIAAEASFLSGAVAGTASASKAVVLNANSSVSGVHTLSAIALDGTLLTSAQPNITAVGALTNLTVLNEVSANAISGTLLSPAQPNITSVGALTTLSVNGPSVLANTTDSTSATTGAMIVSGGVGISKCLFVGADTTIEGSLILMESASISNTTESSSPTTGALAVAGGVGIAKSLYVGADSSFTGICSIANTADASSAATGSLVVAGGAGIAKSLYVGAASTVSGISSVTNTTDASSPNTGALVVAGGVAIAKSIYIGTTATVADTADATSAFTGAITTSGGMGIAKSLYVGTGINGTIMTQAQPNITSIGTLYNLTVANGITAAAINGTIMTQAQPNIKSIGILSSLSVTGGIVAGSISGVLDTPEQPNITSVGILSGIAVNGGDDASSVTTGSIKTVGGMGVAKSLYVGTGIHGTIMIGHQPNITTVGELLGLDVAGDVMIGGSLYIDSVQVSATAEELNYCNATPGVATPLKAIVLDESSAIDSITLSTPLDATSGGTGANVYAEGDILVADSSTTLKKLPASTNTGDLLMSNTSDASKVQWSPGLFLKYINMANPSFIANKQYSIEYLYAKNKAVTNNIMIASPTIIDGNIVAGNTVNAIARSALLGGSIFVSSESNTSIGLTTTFETDFIESDIISITSGSAVNARRIVAVNSNTSITVDSPFTMLNQWRLVGGAAVSTAQSKFGSSSLLINDMVTAYATSTLGDRTTFDGSAAEWTIEFQLYIAGTVADLAIISSAPSSPGFAIRFVYNELGSHLAVSLGNDQTSFNIANDVPSTQTTIDEDEWYHVALVFTGDEYVLFINGDSFTIVTTQTKISADAFQSIQFGADGITAFNGHIDEIRISDVARYSAAFTAPTTSFTEDTNTIMLQHFENATITSSDDTTVNKTFSYYRGGAYGVSYLYAINHATTPGYLLSHRNPSQQLVDLPTGYSAADYAPLNFHLSHLGSNVFKLNESEYAIAPMYSIVSTATNTTPASYDLSAILPYQCRAVNLLLTHMHVGGNVASICIGQSATNSVQSYLPSSTNTVSQMTITIPLLSSDATIQAYLSAGAATTAYTIQVTGYYS